MTGPCAAAIPAVMERHSHFIEGKWQILYNTGNELSSSIGSSFCFTDIQRRIPRGFVFFLSGGIMDIDKRVNEVWEYLHTIPELAFQEVKTSAYLAEALRRAGYDVTEQVGKTGVTGVLKSTRPGPVVAIRSDMDCLANVAGGKEVHGHYCGHDAHMAIVLTVAERLAEEGIPCGTVKILFQPAEEIGEGAKAMVAGGAVEDVDYIIGLHLRPKVYVPLGKASAGIHSSACGSIKVHVTGKTAHGSRPHQGVNAIETGAAMISAVNGIHMDPLLAWSAKVTQFHGGGKAVNAIPAEADLTFDIRCSDNDGMEELIQKVKHAISVSAELTGAKADIAVKHGAVAASFDPVVKKEAEKAIADVLGADNVVSEEQTTGGEDFHFYSFLRPHIRSGFIGLGCDLVPGLHDPSMHFDRRGLAIGVKIMHDWAGRLLTLEKP